MDKKPICNEEFYDDLNSGKLVLFHVERLVKHPHFVALNKDNYFRRSKIVIDTIAVLILPDDVYAVGIAYHSPEDNYYRKKGNFDAWRKARSDYKTGEFPSWTGPFLCIGTTELENTVSKLILDNRKRITLNVAGVKGYSFKETLEWLGKVVRGEHLRKEKGSNDV